MIRGMVILVSVIALSQSAPAQTAREYFNELLAKNAFNLYGDEYACFYDKDTGWFDVISTCKSIEKRSTVKGKKEKLTENDCLIVQTFIKGVLNGTRKFYKADKNSDVEWFYELKSPFSSKIVYLFNWTTLRYRRQFFSRDESRVTEDSGKCELIHPRAP